MGIQTKCNDVFPAGNRATSKDPFLPSDLWPSQFSLHIALHIKACAVETTNRVENILANHCG